MVLPLGPVLALRLRPLLFGSVLTVYLRLLLLGSILALCLRLLCLFAPDIVASASAVVASRSGPVRPACRARTWNRAFGSSALVSLRLRAIAASLRVASAALTFSRKRRRSG